MGFKLAILSLCIYLDALQATSVELFSKWKPEVGWEVECSWTLTPDDSLQSVRLYKNDQQFMIYRPETDGQQRSEQFQLNPDILKVFCAQTADRGSLGQCVMTLEINEPPKEDFNYSCEVSGERPMFRIEKKDITVPAFVPPSNALIHVVTPLLSPEQPGRVTLNCTSSGMPAPNLEWTIGIQKVPNDFSGSSWNMTSKLWNVWSLLSYTPNSERLDVICTPTINRNQQLVKGIPSMYNKADTFHHTVGFMAVVSILLILLR